MSGQPPIGITDRLSTSALERDLAARVDGEVRFDAGSRAAYSTDGSNFRQVPIGVVVPRTVDAAAAAVAVCRQHGVPLLSRGGGTSLAGQCTNEAVVLDWTKYCNRLISVAEDHQTCVVEPGIVLDMLNKQLAPHKVRFGPEPATHMNCTLGGMIGNNSCGATAQRTGKVVDNVAALEVLFYDGTRFWCGPTSDEEYERIERRGDRRAEIYRRLRALADGHAGEIRYRYPRIPRPRIRLQPGLPATRVRVRRRRAPRRKRIDAGRGAAGETQAGTGAARAQPGRARLPEHRQGGRRGPGDRRAQSDRA